MNEAVPARVPSPPPDDWSILFRTEIHRIAERLVRGQPAPSLLQPTMLLNEAYLKLAKESQLDLRDSAGFKAYAGQVMREVLIDHARARETQKRGGHLHRTTLHDEIALTDRPEIDLLALNEALERLETLDARQARVVVLKFFGGLPHDEIAPIVGVSSRQVDTDWRMARAFLKRALE